MSAVDRNKTVLTNKHKLLHKNLDMRKMYFKLCEKTLL